MAKRNEGRTSPRTAPPSPRWAIALVAGALLVGPPSAGAVQGDEAPAARGPVVVERVTPHVVEETLQDVSRRAPFRGWREGEPVRVVPDLLGAEEEAEAEGEEPGTTDDETVDRVPPGVDERDLRDLPRERRWRPGDPVRVIEDLRTEGGLAAAAAAPAAIGESFDGIPATGSLPPDTVGDVGPDHYVQMVNTAFAVYDKQGTLLAGPSPINSLWANFGGPCETQNNGDPIVRYDQLADRWLLSQFALPASGRFHQCFAVSRTADPVSGGWFLYAFPTVDSATGNPVFPDYPKVGVWPDGYYMGTQRGFPNGGLDVWSFERQRMLAGQPAAAVHFSVQAPSIFLMPSDLDGPAPPAGAPNVFIRQVDGERFGGQDRLELFEFAVDWSNPGASSFTPLATLPTAPFDSVLCSSGLLGACVPQPGTSVRLETLTAWPMWRGQYRSFGDREVLLINHTVDADGADLAGIRWYEVARTSGGPWFIFQQGTHAPDEVHRWMGSLAMNGNGDIGLGYSVSSRTVSPGIRAATRSPADPPGSLPDEVVLVDGSGSQTHSSRRWGNYSTLDVDPEDDCTFWYTTEYYDRTSSAGWKTRVVSFAPASCGDGPDGTPDAARQYAAKIVCGIQAEPEELRLARGAYATTINIHNPHALDVTLTKKLALTFPPKEQLPGEILPIGEDRLRSDEALKTDCEDLRRTLFGGTFPAPYIEGFVVVESRHSLDVTAVYSTAALDPRGRPTTHSAIDVERVAERVLEDVPGEESDCADLTVRSIGRPRVDCPGGAGTCTTAVEIDLANVGSADAGPFDVRVVLDPAASVVVDQTVPGGLGAGAGMSLPLVTPPGGGCFDPDCTICVTVDSQDEVRECDETDNRLCETTPG